DRENRNAGAGLRAKGPQCRAVAAEHYADVGRLARGGVGPDALDRGSVEPMLRRLLGGEEQLDPRPPCRRDENLDAGRGLVGAVVREDRRSLNRPRHRLGAHMTALGSASRAATRRSPTPPLAPSVHQTKLSSFPAGPG